MGNFISQSFFIGKPPITLQNLPDQAGRVFIVTGGYAGVGFELSQILHAHNATVYITGRNSSKAADAIQKIKAAHPRSSGKIQFLKLDLADLTSIKPAVEEFRSKEARLDVLVQNAGVMYPPVGSKTAQNHDLQVGTNCLGPYLLYKLLEPLLTQTAASSATASVRVAWAGSVGIEVASPGSSGMTLEADGSPNTKDVSNEANYAQTKTGNYFLTKEFARETSHNGVVHICFNPGNLRTELQRHWKGFSATIVDYVLLYPAIHGAYTELWAAVAPEVTPDKSGSYVWPWGRFGGLRAGVEKAAKYESEGGTGMAAKFRAWCEKETAPFA